MSILRNRLLRRVSIIGRVGDLVLVGGMAIRLAKRQGWIAGAHIDEFGVDPEAADPQARLVEMAVAGAALFRLLRRSRR